MGKHSPSPLDRTPRRSWATAVSALALVLGLAACASGPGGTAADAQSSATLMKVADDTAAGGDPATAATLYRRAHDLSPRDPAPLAKLGATLLALQDYPGAAASYRDAIMLAPTDPDLHRGLGLALLGGGQPEEAIAELDIALQKRANDPQLYSLRGVAQDMAGHYELAQKSYERGLQLAPANVGLRNNYGMSLALAGDYPGAVARLAGIAGPNSAPRYRLNLALAYGLAGDDTKAAVTARQVLDQSAVENNLSYYRLLRGMDAKQRTAAILNTELHGGTIVAADVATAQKFSRVAAAQTPAPPAAAPRTDVAVTDLPPITAPLPPGMSPHAAPVPLLPPQVAGKHAAVAVPANDPSEPLRLALAGPEHGLASSSKPQQDAPALPSPAVASDPPPVAPAPAAAAATPPQLAKKAPVPAPGVTAEKDATAHGHTPSAKPSPSAAASDPPPAPPAPAVVAAPPPVAPDPSTQTAAVDATAKTDMTAPPATPKSDPPPSVAAATPKPEAAAAATDQAPPPDTSPPATAEAPQPQPKAVAAADPADPPAASAPSPAANPAPPAQTVMAEPQKPAQVPATGEHFVVQLGSWLAETSAHHVADQFVAQGVAATVSKVADHDGRTWYVVRAGDFTDAEAAKTACATIKSMGGVSPIVVRLRGKTPSAHAA